MMKKLLLLLLILPIFACGINEQLGGPADLQYVVLEKVTSDLPDADEMDKSNVTNTGYVSLLPDADSERVFTYKYTGIKKRITVRNSTDKTMTYTTSIIANHDGVFFIAPARDREGGGILKDESCFLTEEPYILNPPEITLQSNQSCIFDIFAKPNSSSKLRRLNFTQNPEFGEDFSQPFNDTNVGKYTAVLKVKSSSTLNEYALNVSFIETLPSVTTDNTNEKSNVTKHKSSIDFGYAKKSMDFNGNDTYACDNKDLSNSLCLPFAVVINDKTQGNLFFTFSKSFGQAFKISEYSTCKQVEFIKDSEYTKQLDKAYLPCIIFFNFTPKININYVRTFTFEVPADKSIHSFILNGNTDNKTYPAPLFRVANGTNKYIKFNTVDFSNQTDNFTFDNITINPVKLFITPQSFKETFEGTTTTSTPEEVEIYNASNAREVLDIGFVMALQSFMTAAESKYGSQLTDKFLKNTKTPKANTIQTLAGEEVEAVKFCFPLGTRLIITKECYFEVAFVSNIFTDNKTNDNFTHSNLYTYLLDTSIGTIPMYAKYKSPCDKGENTLDACQPSSGNNKNMLDVDKNEKMTEMVNADDKTIKYENTMNIGEVTRTGEKIRTDNTTYRVYTSLPKTLEGKYLSTTIELIKPLSAPDKPLFTFVEDKENSNSRCTLEKIDPDPSTENKFKFTATLVKPNCSYLVKFEDPTSNEYNDNFNTSKTNFAFIKETVYTEAIDTKAETATTVYYPIYATVMNSIVGRTNNNDTDNITMTFDESFKNTYSRWSFVLKIKKPEDEKTVISLQIDENLSDSFRIMPRTTCDINYSRAKLTRVDFPKNTDPLYENEGIDYCLLVIRAIPPDEQILHSSVIRLTTTVDSITSVVKTYTLNTTGRKSEDVPIYKP